MLQQKQETVEIEAPETACEGDVSIKRGQDFYSNCPLP